MKLSKHLCLECSTCAMFFSSSFTVSIMALFLSKKPSSPTADNTLPMHGDNDKHDCRAVVISLRKMSCTCYTRCLGGNEVPKAHDTYIYNGEKVIS